MKEKRIYIRVDDVMIEQLEIMSKQMKKSRSDIVRDLISNKFARVASGKDRTWDGRII